MSLLADKRSGIVGGVLLGVLALSSSAVAIALISVEDEIELGRQAQAEVRRQVPELRDPMIGAYVARIGQQLVVAASGPRYPYSFSIADYREINAFALPGGPVWIHRGTISAARTEAQLAGVLAHEIAHIAQRHAGDQIAKSLVANGLLGLLGAVLGNDGGARAAQIGARVLAGGIFLKFSRDDEREADRVGAAIMARAGWDPQGMIEFLQILRDRQGRDPSSVEIFLSTHPSPGGRAAELEHELVRGRGGRRDSEAFHDVQRRLSRMAPARPMSQRG